jgi:hypothetical protein
MGGWVDGWMGWWIDRCGRGDSLVEYLSSKQILKHLYKLPYSLQSSESADLEHISYRTLI